MATNSTPRGVRNNNPLNIRLSPQHFKGEVANYQEKEFKTFKAVAWGFRAAFCIIRTYITYKNCNTPRSIIHRWCPDQTAEAYTEYVCQRIKVDPDKRLNFMEKAVMVALVSAMAYFETGVKFSNDTISKSYDMVYADA